MKRNLTTLVLASAVAGAAAFGILVPTSARAGGDCNPAELKLGAVKEACKCGGQKAIKKLMKDAVKKAKAAGKKDYKCTTCHEKANEFDHDELKDGAADKLEPYLAGLKPCE